MVSVSFLELSSLSGLDNIGYKCLTTTVPLCHCFLLASVSLLVWVTSTKLKGEQIWTSLLLLKVLYPILCELWPGQLLVDASDIYRCFVSNCHALAISSCASVHMSRYWACGEFGEHERGVRVAWGAAECNSSLLSALQTSQVLNISTYAQLTHELIDL